MIDVRRNAIEFRGEGNRPAGKIDKGAVVESNVLTGGLLSASRWQASNERA